MKLLGIVLRYLLNINTIWGFMIIVAFCLCLWQHYAPTLTVIPSERLRDGPNTITIRVSTTADQEQAFTFNIAAGPDGLIIPEDLRTDRSDVPSVISTEKTPAGYLLQWRRGDEGEYRVRLNDKAVGSGELGPEVITTLIPENAVVEGENTLVFRIKSPVQAFDFPVVLQAGQLKIPEDQPARSRDRPWLISAASTANAHLLRWDYDGHGKYEVSVNDGTVSGGKLVRLQSLTDAAFDYATSGFEIALGLVAAMVLFLGLMKVGEDAGIVQLVARALHPVIRLLFPGVPKDHPASGAVLMNMTTSILGLGNAATPFGLKAMKELHSLSPHPDIATDAQVMLIAYNTAGFALLPTMLLSVRKAAGCSDPFEIIGTCMITGATSTIVAILAARTLGRLPFFTVRAALAEEQSEAAANPVGSAGNADRKEA